MTTENKDTKQNGETPAQSWRSTVGKELGGIVQFVWDVIKAIVLMIRALVLLIVKTPGELIPSVVQTSSEDEEYNKKLFKKFENIVVLLGLDEVQQRAMVDNWFSQMRWVESRATRERNANELIRWWQIILGVLIPVLIQSQNESVRLLASVAGVFVAVITAVHQFRRPDDRWRHYRILSERYQMEFWTYVTLSGDDYVNKTHKEVFDLFNRKMTDLKRDDVGKFFQEIVPLATASTEQVLDEVYTSLRKQGVLPATDEASG